MGKFAVFLAYSVDAHLSVNGFRKLFVRIFKKRRKMENVQKKLNRM